jgi:NAD(P)-dependent dehydrogenase (short-subunit alcohol dehydrogenase family)
VSIERTGLVIVGGTGLVGKAMCSLASKPKLQVLSISRSSGGTESEKGVLHLVADATDANFGNQVVAAIKDERFKNVKNWSVVLAFGETPARHVSPSEILKLGVAFEPLKFQAYVRASCSILHALDATRSNAAYSRIGKMILLGSESAFYGRTGLPFYSAENAAIHQFVFAIAPVFAELGVSVFGVSPGSVSTGSDSGVVPSKLVELAETIIWLATDAPSTLSGSTLRLSSN